MRRFIIDEWLWADLQGENGLSKQNESLSFLLRVFEQCDQLVTVEGCPFLKKFYDLCEKAGIGDLRRRIVKVFKAEFFQNSKKLRRFQESDLAKLPHEIAHTVKEDDKYLVALYNKSEADLLVTTDNSLMEVLKNCGINCQDRDSFLSDYMGEALT